MNIYQLVPLLFMFMPIKGRVTFFIRPIIQGIIAEKGLDVKLSRDNVIPSLNGSI